MAKPRRTHCPHCHAEYPADHWKKIDAARALTCRTTANERRKIGGNWGGYKLIDPIKVMELRGLGLSPKLIAEELGVTAGAVRRTILNQLKKQGPISGACDANHR